jgi:hypothetical protein
MTELLQVMVAKRGILVYQTATQHPISVVANRSLSFRHNRQGEQILIGVGVLLWPRICISLVWRRP